jgi:solute carrier family 25 carnitine/acylcarnitine transporter 20/29
MAAPLVGVAPMFAVFFGGCAIGRWVQQTQPGQKMTFVQNGIAGAIAGLLTTYLSSFTINLHIT